MKSLKKNIIATSPISWHRPLSYPFMTPYAGLVWTAEERAALQAFLSNFTGKELMLLFWKLEREIGLQEALKCFKKVVDLGREELEHDVMGCRDCWVHGDIVYCEKSKYHPNHPHNCCPPWQNCYCLAPEYSSDLSTPHPKLYYYSFAWMNWIWVAPSPLCHEFLSKRVISLR